MKEREVHLFSKSYSSGFSEEIDDVELESVLLQPGQAQAVAHLSSPPDQPLTKPVTHSAVEHSNETQKASRAALKPSGTD